jgi:hypothetical protein
MTSGIIIPPLLAVNGHVRISVRSHVTQSEILGHKPIVDNNLNAIVMASSKRKAAEEFCGY